MATFEQIGLTFQILNNIHGLVRNMRDNASGYKAQVLRGLPISDIASNMKGDAAEYIRRIQWVTDLATRNLTLLTNSLTAMGLTIAEANSLKAALLTSANRTAAATITTASQVNTESDAILSAIPNFERIF